MKNKLFLLAFIASATLYAEEVQLDKSVINSSATYNGSITGNENKNIVLITKDDIEKKQYKDIVEVFKDSPTTMVTYTQAGPMIALRGSGEKTIMRVNILLNGMPINTIDESMGIIPFNAIPVDSIEKIEIIPGGGITLYGSGSSSGVINIVTNKTNKSSYGSISYSRSSFDTNNVQVSKGIKINDHLFADIAVEGKKGHGYRDKEDHKKINVIGGIDYRINDHHKFRLEGSKFKAKDLGTNELTWKELAKDRRGAGKSDFDVDSDRDSFTTRYEYTPNDKFSFSAAYNQSDFTRKINQQNRPYLTFLPSEGFNNVFGLPSGYEADLVMLNVHNDLDGSIEEKIKNFKAKGDYKYDRGNFIFGFDHSDHRLKREMNINVLPFYPAKQVKYFLRPIWETVLDEEVVDKRKDDYVFDPSKIFAIAFGFEDFSDDIDVDKSVSYFANEAKHVIKEVVEEIESGLKDPEKNRILKQQMGEINYKNLVDDMKALREQYGDFSDPANPAQFGYTEVSYSFWRVLSVLPKLPMKNFLKDGVTESIPNIMDENYNTYKGKPIKITDNTTVQDYFDAMLRQQYHLKPGEELPLPKQTSIVNSWVDVKKETDSFYLYNDFDITDKLTLDAGVRYEKATYKGKRHTDATQIITVKADKDGSYENAAEVAAPHLGLLCGLAESNLRGEKSENWTNKMYHEKMEDLKETGVAVVPMMRMDIDSNKTEENIGGNIGLTYKFNDTDAVYGKYERAFNSPLPTQFTNKTIDPKTKVKAYWESHIESETMDNFEIGFRGMLNDNISYSVSGFLSNTHNEILSVVKNGSSHMNREWRYINLEKTRRMGVELQSEQNFDKLHLKESITYVDPKILSDDLEKSTRQIYEDAIDLTLKKNIGWISNTMDKYYLALNKKEAVSNVSFEDRQKLSAALTPIYKQLVYKEINAATGKEKVEKILKTYKDKYANVNVGSFFSQIENQLLPTSYPGFGSVERMSTYKDRISEIYHDELETAIKGQFLGKGDKIPLSPKVKATFSADYDITDKLTLGTNFTYIGSFENAEPVNGYGIKTVNVPSHVVTDIYGTYNYNEDLSIKFGINNVFKHDYYLRQDSKTATPAPGRTYTAGFTYRF